MTKKAKNWLRQEKEMCEYRVRIYFGKPRLITHFLGSVYETGNPMSPEEAEMHLKNVEKYIENNPKLYQD